jgi:hypothetical protein
MDRQAAITFVRSAGDLIEQAGLDYILVAKPPSDPVREQLFLGQREDGGWSPMGAGPARTAHSETFTLQWRP